jgi:hypothetical protein
MTRGPAARRPPCYRAVLVATVKGNVYPIFFECEGTALERWLELKVYLGNWSLKAEPSQERILIE